jgi:hypothetical protein
VVVVVVVAVVVVVVVVVVAVVVAVVHVCVGFRNGAIIRNFDHVKLQVH